MKKTISVAPMMDCTDRHERYFLSLISQNIQLYSEMIVSNAIIRGDRDKILSFKKVKNPTIIQLGGSNPSELAEACKISEQYGYDEINLNLGCPSKKVQKNKFGACLMKEPGLVADCVNAMVNATKLPVSIKTRIGYNDIEDFEFLKNFISTIKKAGTKKFIIHARRAILTKLSPKQNLSVPPLKYDFVYRLKKEFKEDEVVINGGITETNQIEDHLKKVDGVMIGRAIYHSPYFLAEIEKKIFKNDNVLTRNEIMEKLIPYIQVETKKGVQLNHVMRHTVGLFHGQSGSKKWKQYLSKNMCIRDADIQKVDHIMDQIKKNDNSTFLER
jgi:tRNA-dihydrouridine synthase A|tara:strand:- start:958 stop:1944 length:987 start_codon:yes stop_codon:yes gene_type:complete